MSTWNLSRTKQHVFLCNGGSCTREGAEELTKAIRAAITDAGLDDQVHTTKTMCNGRCEDSCVVIVYPEGIWYRKMTPQLAREFVLKQLVGGEPLPGHVSHQRGENGFERAGEAPEGIFKSEKKK
ncbi:(2Fe-2S) ferredoxin domain-containing protein [Brevibacillus composti]|uniref:(2Fe-2S) ferredoxin domain-containing protein n=1 Tax=Brevibacillus composti TaxID=2796470 RepID=A0A7T5JM28_9BACL|nr:(2Fe-2S) ferredoxin domain-containing protein [Brevibacillus composti]QQE72601.1 (2Fe-2S) ferredoxin domain-containing protein [Brevibacillus composti]QUO39678.1 (2Fe-2S) ferredoxin domain-containing protein [Brevibacillus composti]